MIYRRQYPRRLGPMIATQPAQRVTPRSLSARPPVDPEPSVSPEPARTPVVGSPRPCPVCGETELQGRQAVCPASCRRERAPQRETAARQARDREIRALLEAALRKRQAKGP
jgi:hypothetical protein